MKLQTVPVLLLTGYLGSGKTTLVNHILTNERGIKFAVIVNDIGEINIDAKLIERGGIVDKKDDSLVALQNGCICCTLKMDLVKQIQDIIALNKFDYIVIEASGICEPEPIAQTIVSVQQLSGRNFGHELCRLDCIVTVVDALRMQSEFGCGDSLVEKKIAEEDIENLVIQQIEFCDIILLNKSSEVSLEERERIKKIIRALQPKAEIIECDYANVELTKLINTRRFNFDSSTLSAGWVAEMDKPVSELENEDESEEVEEYGISTFIYYRRPAFDLVKFDALVAKKWNRNIIRTKGVCYFKQNPEMSYMFEQSGVQKKVTEAGQWLCTAPKYELKQMIADNPEILDDWDDEYGDKMQKIVFIGQNMDKEMIVKELDECLVK